jgi:hypothetical protein
VAGARGDPQTDGNKNLYLHNDAERFPWQGEVLTIHLVRLTSTLWGALTVLLTYLTGRTIFRSAWPAIGAAAVVAFTPEFLFMSSAINNDVAVAAACSLLLYLASKVATRPTGWGHAIALGIAGGSVIMTKPIAVGAIALIPVAVIIGAHRVNRSAREVVSRLGIAFAVIALSTTWWFARNVLNYGTATPVQSFLSRSDLLAEMPSLATFVSDLNGLWLSYWAFFGWFSISVPIVYYRYYDVLTILALFGIGIIVMTRRFPAPKLPRLEPAVLLLPGILLVSVVAGVFSYRLVVRAFHGRLLLGAVSGIALLYVTGWISFARGRRAEYLGVALAFSLAIPAALFPWTVLRPAYAVPDLVPIEKVRPSVPVDVTFGNTIRLVGVDVPTAGVRARAGDSLSTALYLQGLHPAPADYLLFLKVVDPSGRVIAELNSHPGHGAYPTSQWVEGPVLVDHYSIVIPQSFAGPAVGRIFLGFFRQGSAENLPVLASDGSSLGSSVQIGTVVISGTVNPSRALAGVAFLEGNRPAISLVDSHMDTESVRAGAELGGFVTFGGIERASHDYTVFVHLERDGRLVAQDDSPPLRGTYPTTIWATGDIVEHRWKMTLPVTANPGEYTLRVGLYDPVTGLRLTTSTGDSIDLGVVRVE